MSLTPEEIATLTAEADRIGVTFTIVETDGTEHNIGTASPSKRVLLLHAMSNKDLNKTSLGLSDKIVTGRFTPPKRHKFSEQLNKIMPMAEPVKAKAHKPRNARCQGCGQKNKRCTCAAQKKAS